jgi:5-methyltetrahydrofolate--homocysteine methyltransferase
MMGVKPESMAETIGALDVDVLGINCGRSLDENLDALGQLRQATDKPLWFKPNAGLPEMDEDGKPTYSVSPAEMGALVPDWLAAGAQLVGGCCGTSPDHLAEIAKAVRAG